MDSLSELCGSQFWDSNLTWYSESPEFTSCFHNTVLVWIPCAFLWIFSPLRLVLLFKENSLEKMEWTNLYLSKIALLLLVTVISIINIVCVLHEENRLYIVLLGHILKFGAYGLILLLLLFERISGENASTIHVFFWFLSLVAGTITVRWRISNIITEDVFEDGFIFTFYVIEYCLVLIMFVLSFFNDKTTQSKKHIGSSDSNSAPKSPQETASTLSILTFSWLTETLLKGWKNSISSSDVYELLYPEKSLTVSEKFGKYWKYRPQRKKALEMETEMEVFLSNDVPETEIRMAEHSSITMSLFRAFGFLLFQAAMLRNLADLILFANPEFLKLLIEFASNDEPLWKGIFYATAMFLVNVVQGIISESSAFRATKLGMQLKSALMYTIYQKTLRLSTSNRKTISVGQILNTMAVDAAKFDRLTRITNSAWSAPLMIILAFYFLWREIGVATLAGLFLITITIPLNTFMAKKIKLMEEKYLKAKDKRMKMMSEVLNGIRVLKMYAWEKSFERIITDLRIKEAQALKKQQYINAAALTLYMVTPILVALFSFAVFVLIDEKNLLSASTAFVCLGLFAMLKRPLIDLPEVVNQIIRTKVSLERISKVLQSDEFEDYTFRPEENKYAIVMKEASLSWEKATKPTLENISLSIPKGSLVAIVGPVGCGKSSLIASLLCEIEKIHGDVTIEGSIGYVSQQPWIQNESLRGNILFLKDMNEKRYAEVLAACALEEDLKVLPANDLTEIGEKGINLSGGQKQRVSIARAVYLNADIYLLDDPLGAVDAHVAKHVFEQVISSKGLLKDKTRILVTHNLTFLPQVDQIIFMDNGQIVEKGSFHEIMNSDGLVKEYLTNHMEEGSNEEGLNNEKRISKEDLSLENKGKGLDHKKKQSKIISDEKVEKGSTSFAVYLNYIKTVGRPWILLIITSILGFHALNMGSSYWLSLWSEDSIAGNAVFASRRNMRLTVFGVLGFAQGLAWLMLGIIMTYSTLKASISLHSGMLRSIFHSPTKFFDTTPMGRVLNRFSKDIDVLDQELPASLRNFLNNLAEFFITTVSVCIAIPVFLVPVTIVSILFAFIQRLYVATNSQLRRISSTRSSFLFSHFSESLNGLPIIRASKASPRFLSKCRKLIDDSTATEYLSQMASGWLEIRFTIIGKFLLYCASLFTALAKGWISPGIVGFVISNASNILFCIPRVVRLSVTVESNIVSVERIHEYSNLEEEAPWEISNSQIRSSWPEAGRISFRNCNARYREELDLILKDICFDINPREKIGIVGRTGAGKSSITMVLFRLMELSSGEIKIDDIDISTVGLYDLRSRLTIIPQDPVLFSGTLRLNLDPFDSYNEETIWSALEHSHLKSFVKSLKGGLDHQVTEGGENLSVGQRQLVCLARALLRNTRILVLDEATASVDLDTDDMIQKTIRDEFSESTIITIAHRLNTIMDYDRVLVLDHGSVAEFDTPNNLLTRQDSLFYSLVKNANLDK